MLAAVHRRGNRTAEKAHAHCQGNHGLYEAEGGGGARGDDGDGLAPWASRRGCGGYSRGRKGGAPCKCVTKRPDRRSRRSDRAPCEIVSHYATLCHAILRDVTRCHAMSRDVTRRSDLEPWEIVSLGDLAAARAGGMSPDRICAGSHFPMDALSKWCVLLLPSSSWLEPTSDAPSR